MRPRRNLDFLRTFAVLTVLVDHVAVLLARPLFQGWDLRWTGVFGVYLFFVHTSLVLMWSLERRPATLNFYVRRIFRIYPLAILAICAALALHTDGGQHRAMAPAGSVILSNLLLVQDVWARANVLNVLWSLPLEVHMYVLLPVLFAFTQREDALWPWLLLWSMACILATNLVGWRQSNWPYVVVPCFLPGIMAYIGFRTRRASLPAWTLLAFLMLALSGFMLRPAPPTGWVACLATGLVLPLIRDMNDGLLATLSQKVATYSYGIYLLHPLCLWSCFHLLATLPAWVRVAAGLVLTGVLAMASYHLLEAPMVRLGARIADKLAHHSASRLAARDLQLEVAP